MVLERYNACQTVAFCGAFPEIKRAWATVDSRLYLWRYDRWWVPPAAGSLEACAGECLAGARQDETTPFRPA